MAGFVTDKHLGEAEECFPGIGRLYNRLVAEGRQPATFLDLVAAWLAANNEG